ncbi:MAG: exonuclease SbcCD subunit D [Gemmatimonadales bacterium]|nr:MAG: exonuclease SbcCD subunit D [Gemmatimonadales bacterium]
MRILHLADLHLDTLFAARSPELRDRLREAGREVLRRAVSLAIEREVDGVLMAGDLFDGRRLSYRTERFLLRELERLGEAGIPFLYCTGNHDPGQGIAGSGRIEWPDHVELFDRPQPRTVELRRDGEVVGTVTAAGHAVAHEADDLSTRFPSPSSWRDSQPAESGAPDAVGPEGQAGAGLPAVAMLHTQVTGAGGAADHDRYAPSELPNLRRAGYDYWALGHIHLREALERLPGIHYPGNPQGRSPRETGAKGALLVELPGAGVAPSVEFVELAPVRWERLEVDGLRAATTFDEFIGIVGDRWRELRAEDPGLPGTQWIVRLVPVGASPLAAELDHPESRRDLGDEIARTLDLLGVELRVEGIRSTVDPDQYRERRDPAGLALRLLAEAESREGTAALIERIGLDPAELAGFRDAPESDPSGYVRRLLGGGLGARILIEHFRREGESP